MDKEKRIGGDITGKRKVKKVRSKQKEKMIMMNKKKRKENYKKDVTNRARK